MSVKEFPKAVYKDGDSTQEVRIADDAEMEGVLSKMGFVPVKPPKEDPNSEVGKILYNTNGLVSDVKTELAAEKPEDGYIYATTGSAATPGHFAPDKPTKGEKITKPTNPLPQASDAEYKKAK